MAERASSGDPPLSGVGVTALIVAQARAAERHRPDRLFDDPFAEGFVERAGPEFLAAAADLAPILRLRGNGSYFAIRTRFFDDCLLDAARSGCRQVVVLGAGLDTRAFRLALPPRTSLFELDLPDVLDFKEEVLAARSASPTCRRVALPLDLREDWPGVLVAAGFQPGEPTAWLAEGIVIYLSEPERDRLLDSVGGLSAPGSRLALEQRGVPDQVGPIPEQAKRLGETVVERFGVKTSDERPDPSMVDPGGWLFRRGWRATVTSAAEVFVRYGRTVPEALVTGAVRLWLATAERR
jgi:methyltransferase (TIGR00027 family)